MKYFVIVTMLGFLLLFTSCNSVYEITDRDKLTKSESQYLVNRSREYIQMVKHLKMSKEDKKFVRENLPKTYIQYYGYKQGVARLVWRINPSYSIRIISKGDLLDSKCPTRMTVTRFKQ